jgi:hypothetical protein
MRVRVRAYAHVVHCAQAKKEIAASYGNFTDAEALKQELKAKRESQEHIADELKTLEAVEEVRCEGLESDARPVGGCVVCVHVC